MKRSPRVLIALAAFVFSASASAVAPPPRPASPRLLPLPNVNAYHAAGPSVPPPMPGALPLAFVAGTDEHRGIPTFLWAIGNAANAALSVTGLTAEDAARAYLAAHAPRYGLTPAALSTAQVVRVLDVGRGGIVVVLRQRVAGVEVFHADVKVLMDRNLALVAIGGNLHAGAVPAPKTRGFVRAPTEALVSAFRDLYGLALSAGDLVDVKRRDAAFTHYAFAPTKAVKASALRLVEPARVEPVYFPLPDRIVPAYYLEILATPAAGAPADAYAYVFAADDGRLLFREDLTHYDTFHYRTWADQAGDKRPANGPLAKFTPHPTGMPDGSYPAPFAAGLISIDAFNKTADPWLPTGAQQSQGNNVDAYTDDNMPEGFSPGDTRALTTSASTFDHSYDLAAGPQSSLEQRQAAVTDMFYVANWLHDWWYDSGFDEKGGNAQQDNFGRGGAQGDPLLAEGQYGAPLVRNNSNMAVPADGMSPRMHMFVWDGVATATLTAQPGNLTPPVGVAGFGPQAFNVTGAVVLVDDGTLPNVNDGCEALVNGAAVSGHVAVLDRGNCTFKNKVVNAQAAGAIGVILVDDKPGQGPPGLSDDPMNMTAVTIPVLSVAMADGAAFKAAPQGTLAATLSRATSPDRDGTIDNSIVAHEWGHYLHLRHVTCGTRQCGAQSEGWADFNALMMAVRQGDDFGGTYAIGQYATASFPNDPAYFGIRRYPYTVDLARNPLTFKYISAGTALPAGPPFATGNIAPNSEVHAAGEIWASMLFEGYSALLLQTQAANPPYTFAQARRRMSDYVVAGMTMAPANPTYTEQRDAILAAATAADPNDAMLLAAAFAKRGAGTCAVSPGRDSTDFSGLVESFTVSAKPTITLATVDDGVTSCDGADGYLDAGETGNVTVHLINGSPLAVANATATLTSSTPGVSFPVGATVTFGNLGAFATATGSAPIALAASVSGKANLDLHVTLNGAGCSAAPLAVTPFINVIEVPASATSDDVEAKSTTWTTTGTMADQIWSRVTSPSPNHVWSGIDYGSPSDTALVSPPLTVSTVNPLVISFDHAHSFESTKGVNYDGSVIEVSTDAGKTWADVSTYGDPGYGGTIGDPMNMAKNVLKDRKGYVATNPSWPATDKVSINLGTKLAGKTVQIRFRIGTDDAQSDTGWQLDNLGFQGITNTPFAALVPDTSPCGGSTTSSSSSSSSASSSSSSSSATSASSSASSVSSTGSASGTGGHDAVSVHGSGGCSCRAVGAHQDGRALDAQLLGLSALLLTLARRKGARRARE